MRLTLRTLLSYLDNVLEEPARSELRTQIETNEHATEWVHRTRDVMRRLRLGAPEIGGSGSVDDPNTVGEYLDRTLPEESVANFERVCLESDEMLAEVASCHHVLAMFLESPAEVDPDTRKRLIRLQEELAIAKRARIEQAHQAPVDGPEQAAAPAEQPATPPPGRREKPQRAPDYLRESGSSGLKQWLPAIAALLLLAVTVALAFGPGGWLRPVAKAEPAEEVDPAKPKPDAPAEPDAVDPASPEADPAAEGPEAAESDEPTEEAAADPVGEEKPIEASEPEPAVVEPSEPTVPQPQSQPALPADPAPPQVAEEQPEQGLVGPFRLVGDGEAVLVARKGAEEWRRISPDAEVGVGMELASLPTYRSALSLGGGASMELVGASHVMLGADSASPGSAEIDLLYGRVVIRVAEDAEEPVAVALRLGDSAYSAVLDPGASIALHVDRPFQRGLQLTESSAPLAAVAESLGGAVRWDGGGMRLEVDQPRRWPVAGADVFGDFAWVEKLDMGPADKMAGPELAAALAGDEPVESQLRDVLANEVFREVRALAARSALELGSPGPLVASFGDRDLASAWRENLVELRQAASRSPARARRIKSAFSDVYDEDLAEPLLRLAAGFSRDQVGSTPEEVSEGAVAEFIVPGLESKDLAVRVLASLALEESVEPLDRPFSALAPLPRRNNAVRQIKKRLQDKNLGPNDR